MKKDLENIKQTCRTCIMPEMKVLGFTDVDVGCSVSLSRLPAVARLPHYVYRSTGHGGGTAAAPPQKGSRSRHHQCLRPRCSH
jgi:hypothetical protein